MPPRLREDLVAATVEADGVVYVDVADPVTGVNFRFYDFEYELAKQFTGQELDAVAAWGSATYGMELTKDTLDQFVEKLTGLGFLAGTGAGGAQPAVLSPGSTSSGRNPVALQVPTDGEAAPPVADDKPVPPAPASAALPSPVAPALATTATTTGGPLRLVPPTPPPRANAAPTAPIPSESSAPLALTEGDPAEFRLNDVKPEPAARSESKPSPPAETSPAPEAPTDAKPVAVKPDKSANWGRGRTLHGISLAPLLPQAAIPGGDGANGGGNGSGPTALPRLQALGSPLPPLSSQPAVKPVSLPTPVEPRRPTSAVEETPLASITHAIVAEAAAPSTATAPSHALEPGISGPNAPAGNLAAFTAGIATATVVGSPTGITSPSTISPPVNLGSATPGQSADGEASTASATSTASAAWANALAEAVESPLVERRQPPAPEVVVMPPVVDKSAMPPVPKRHAPLVVGGILVAALAAAAIYATRNGSDAAPERPAATALAVHVVSPQPTTFYRWFTPTGTVMAGKDDELSFKLPGKLQDVMPPGTTFSAGEAVARLQGVAARELAVNRARARLAFVEQLRDSSRAAGNEGAARAAEVGLAARKKELADAQTKLSEMEIRPASAGVIGEVLLGRGALVKAGAPVFRIRAAGPRATFALSSEDRATLRRLGFCRLETIPSAPATDAGATDKLARAIDCTLAPAPADSNEPVAVDMVGTVAPGTQVRLAAARFDGVFPIPRSAVTHEIVGDHKMDRVWLASGSAATAESRGVELAGTVDQQALVSRGLTAGDAVIVDPPATLINGTPLNVLR
jgi:hypothetical protein